jgi:hypothetical protein
MIVFSPHHHIKGSFGSVEGVLRLRGHNSYSKQRPPAPGPDSWPPRPGIPLQVPLAPAPPLQSAASQGDAAPVPLIWPPNGPSGKNFLPLVD